MQGESWGGSFTQRNWLQIFQTHPWGQPLFWDTVPGAWGFVLGDSTSVREAEFVQRGAEQGGEDAWRREDGALGREDAQSAFGRKSSAVSNCWTRNDPRRALCDEKPLGQGSPGPVMLASPALRDALKCGGMRAASHVMTLSWVGMPLRPSGSFSGDVLGLAGILAWE